MPTWIGSRTPAATLPNLRRLDLESTEATDDGVAGMVTATLSATLFWLSLFVLAGLVF